MGMNYCPETVLVHSAFLLADKEAVRGLNELEKGKFSRAVQVVTGAISEIAQGSLSEKHEVHQSEIRQLEFKIHTWIFHSLCKEYVSSETSEGSTDQEYFDSFPPLPQIGVRFYLELVQEVGWSELLVECFYNLDVENGTTLLKDIIKSLTHDPSFKDLSLFLCIFKSLLMTSTRSHFSPSDSPGENLRDTSGSGKSYSLTLLESVLSLKKDLISWPEAQREIVKDIVDFIVIDIVYLNFRKNCAQEDSGKVNYEHQMPQNSDLYTKHGLYSMKEDELEERECAKSEHRDGRNSSGRQNSDLVISTECAFSIDLLCQVMIDDWKEISHWTESNLSNNCSVGEVDYSSRHPLHKYLVKLYAVACLLVPHSSDNKLQEQAATLQNGLLQYVKKFATEREQMWIESFKKGELNVSEESIIKEEFSFTFGSVGLVLFVPETTEEQFQFYLQRVNGRLEGYKACFDWLLSAEEFHAESDWLECMRNHAIDISDIQHAVKMIDIIYMQRQSICSDDKSSDTVYRNIKEILLTLHSSLPCCAQEQIIQYAFFMSLTLESPENNSIFFHPWYVEVERMTFHHQLVMLFNKLSSEDQLQSSAADLSTALLISAPLTLNKAMQEGVKSAGHTKTICSVLQTFPSLCELRYTCNESDSSRTLLCQALMSVTVSVSSKQENNLLNMVATMLTSSPTQLLHVQEFTEAIVLPFLNNTSVQGDIPTVLALKLHNTLMDAVMTSISLQLPFLKKHVLSIILCLCELLNECNVFWEGMALVHPLSEMEELRELVLTALHSEIKICLEVLETNPALATGVQWLLRRLKSGFDWTVPLHLESLFSAANIKYKLAIPSCLLSLCGESGDKWIADESLIYCTGDVFTELFEYCRVSDSALQWILESLTPHKLLNSGCKDIRRSVVMGLTQILPHCIWTEWRRVLKMCRYLVKKGILQVTSTASAPCSKTNGSGQDVFQLSAILFDMLEVLHNPSCTAWATLHVWLYVIKHYITAIKEIVDGITDAEPTALVFAHVCHVMTFAPADCIDQLFVLALDLVARPSASNSDIIARMKNSINSLSCEVHRAALTQKLGHDL